VLGLFTDAGLPVSLHGDRALTATVGDEFELLFLRAQDIPELVARWCRGRRRHWHQERAQRVGMALLANPPPPGWRPLSPDDELLRTLLPDEEA
jgi:hypothetical protein